MRGGIYAWRTRKPWALIGLPLIGRHWAYIGMTNSYSAREGQHLRGSELYGTRPASWSDLRPRCYRILPLPALITHGRHRRKIMQAIETLLIWTLCPVYNERQQGVWNLRRISRRRAAQARVARDTFGFSVRLVGFGWRAVMWGIIWGVLLYAWSEGRIA